VGRRCAVIERELAKLTKEPSRSAGELEPLPIMNINLESCRIGHYVRPTLRAHLWESVC
jgi:hypothetical protein